MSIVTLENDLIHYEVLGRGRPVVFLHGWVGSWRYWIPTMQASSTSYRTYALDLWGFGDTPNKPEKYSLEAQARLLNSFLDEMGIGKIALVGHGLGSLVGIYYGHLFPNTVDRLVLTGIPMNSAMVNPRLRNATMGDLTEWLLGKTSAADTARAEAQKADPQAIHASLDALESINLLDLIMAMGTPCLFVQGALDPVIELYPDDVFAQLPDYTHQIVFDGSGHFPMLDEPARYNRLLADFLSLPSGESPRSLQIKDEWRRRIR